MKKVFTWYFIIFAVIAVLILLLVPNPAEKSNTLGGLVIAAVVSLFFIIKSLNDQWSGTITDIKTEKKYQADDDGRGETYDVDYAYIKLSNGKTKKTKSKNNWKVGDKLEKRRGQATVQIIS
jgi:competence protein ComGC